MYTIPLRKKISHTLTKLRILAAKIHTNLVVSVYIAYALYGNTYCQWNNVIGQHDIFLSMPP